MTRTPLKPYILGMPLKHGVLRTVPYAQTFCCHTGPNGGDWHWAPDTSTDVWYLKDGDKAFASFDVAHGVAIIYTGERNGQVQNYCLTLAVISGLSVQRTPDYL